MKRDKVNIFQSYYVIIAVCLIVAIICICKIISELYIDRQGQNYYKTLADEAIGENYTVNNEPKALTEAIDGISDTTQYINPDTIPDKTLGSNSDMSADLNSDNTQITVPNAEEIQDSLIDSQSSRILEQLLNVDINALQKTIPDIVAWIRCEGTVIDYPVVKGIDNDFYLNHLPDGTNSRMGSIFLDCNNSGDFSDLNSVIYGHHMRSGDMFSALEGYREQSFYDKHPVIELYTQDHAYILELFAGYVVNARHETIPISFSNQDDYMKYIDEIKKRSTFQSSVILSKDDKIISLCTCTYSSADARFIIVGKLHRL